MAPRPHGEISEQGGEYLMLFKLLCEKTHKSNPRVLCFKFNPMVADLTGRSVLVTRYFRAIRPPHDVLENNDKNAEKVAWFVSLIPYLPRNALFPGIQVAFCINIKRMHVLK